MRTETGRMQTRTFDVLVVHPQALVREGIARLVVQLEDVRDVSQAATIGEAIAIASQVRPDVIMVDGDAEPVDAGGLRSAYPEANVLVIAERAAQDKVRRAMSTGAQGFTLKQVTFPELADVLRRVARGETYLHPEAAVVVVRSIGQPDRDRTMLTDRQKEVLRLVALGLQNGEIATRLNVGVDTVKTHLTRILRKLGVSSRTEAVARGLRDGLL